MMPLFMSSASPMPVNTALKDRIIANVPAMRYSRYDPPGTSMELPNT